MVEESEELFFLLEPDDAAAAVVDDDGVRTTLVSPVVDDVVRGDGPTIRDIPVSSVFAVTLVVLLLAGVVISVIGSGGTNRSSFFCISLHT